MLLPTGQHRGGAVKGGGSAGQQYIKFISRNYDYFVRSLLRVFLISISHFPQLCVRTLFLLRLLLLCLFLFLLLLLLSVLLLLLVHFNGHCVCLLPAASIPFALLLLLCLFVFCSLSFVPIAPEEFGYNWQQEAARAGSEPISYAEICLINTLNGDLMVVHSSSDM